MIGCMITSKFRITLVLAMELTFQKTFGPLRCGLSIFTDDALNGGIVSDGESFFAGVNTIQSQLSYLS